MTEQDVIDIIVNHMENLFPLSCMNCNKLFHSYKDFLLHSERLGPPNAYDEKFHLDKRFIVLKPMGPHTDYSCKCGHMIRIGSTGMKKMRLLKIMFWSRNERRKRNISINKLLVEISQKVDEVVMDSQWH